MRVMVDTNVLISAAYNPNGTYKIIFVGIASRQAAQCAPVRNIFYK
jgi:predicted nucleic acid-binding protein